MRLPFFAPSELLEPRSSLVARQDNSTGNSTQAPPRPIEVSTSYQFDGNDGPWSTFAFRVGTPAQVVRLLVDTSGQQTKVIGPEACPGDFEAQKACSRARGYLYNKNTSSTWEGVGLFQIAEQWNLPYQGNAEFGLDTVGLSWQGENGVTLDGQIVGRTPAADFYLGLFGVNPKPTNWSYNGFNDPQPSYMSTLRSQKIIPSLSYGYTAGAYYQLQGVHGSLILGGYDESLIDEPSGLSFPLNSDPYRDIVVGVSEISWGVGSNFAPLFSSPEPIYALLDGGTPHIWLPREACTAFEEAFNLHYDETTDLYLIDDSLHNQLIAQNPSVSFTLTNQGTTNGPVGSVNITFPYRSFDLTATAAYPGIQGNSSRYFPLRRAANSTQYTLGRTFLQESYLTVDYDRGNFSVNQRIFGSNRPQNIVPIYAPGEGPPPPPPGSTSASSSSSLSGGAIAGITIGSIAGLALLTLLVFLLLRKRRKTAQEAATTREMEKVDKKASPAGHELNDTAVHEAHGDETRHEMDGDEGKKYEMADQPKVHELPLSPVTPAELPA
ncbi:acid protease [Aulographum hederae CBS 113979]|uniref:Acid protease n=1 Tax=Aulographum hederae CBS 113979 TaxID=1176131 RepID=A0A6G1HDL7_9PEZI|nr:acid protease [Aulographum hederae CBS 113979]